MPAPDLEFLFRVEVEAGEEVPVGDTPYGSVRFTHAVGGTVEGPRLRGELLPLGGDRVVGRADGTFEINVLQPIRTHDGHTILMTYKGLIRGLDESADGPSDPSQVYWRTAPMFETAAEPYAWLNGLVAVGVGGFISPGKVGYEIYAVS